MQTTAEELKEESLITGELSCGIDKEMGDIEEKKEDVELRSCKIGSGESISIYYKGQNTQVDPKSHFLFPPKDAQDRSNNSNSTAIDTQGNSKCTYPFGHINTLKHSSKGTHSNYSYNRQTSRSYSNKKVSFDDSLLDKMAKFIGSSPHRNLESIGELSQESTENSFDLHSLLKESIDSQRPLEITEENYAQKIMQKVAPDPVKRAGFLKLFKKYLLREKKEQFSQQPMYKEIITSKIGNIYFPADLNVTMKKVNIYIYIYIYIIVENRI